MSSSPRFWQKLGLGKHHKSSSNASQSDNVSVNSTTAVQQSEASTIVDNYYGKQLKRYNSNISLRHKSSSISLYQQSLNTIEKQPRRSSYIKPLRQADPVDASLKVNESNEAGNGLLVPDPTAAVNTSVDISLPSPGGRISPTNPSSTGMMRSPLTRLPTATSFYLPLSRRQTLIESPSASRPPSRLLKKTKSSQSLLSSTKTNADRQKASGCTKLRQQYPQAVPLVRSDSNDSIQTMTKKKSSIKIAPSSSEEDNKSCLTPSSSNSSSATSKCKSEDKKLITTSTQTEISDNDVQITFLKDELEREKSSARALLGQKEAIARDLDYFCKLVDEVTEKKDDYKKRYEEEMSQNESLKNTIRDLELRLQSRNETSPVYRHKQEAEHKSDEIYKLKSDLKQSQKQIQILRKTMEQLLKVDGKDYLDDDVEIEGNITSSVYESSLESKRLLLQVGYQPEENTIAITNPPSPLPFNYSINMDDDDLISVTSKDSSSSRSHQAQYNFLKLDEDGHYHNMPTRRSEDFSKKLALSRRRKNQLEEMLGEVDSQLNRVKQKMRPTT